MREMNFPCTKCGNGVFVQKEVAALKAELISCACSKCSHTHTLNCGTDPHYLSGEGIHQCLLCGCREFYIQKDFNRVIGILLVIAACIAAPFTYFLSLLVLSMLDFFLFRRLPLVTVCYGCEGVYRGQPLNEEHVGFDLKIRDKYRFGQSAT